ncbi:MAG: DNA polymerase I [Patescibacteria group bacterium]|nr:DNA polymerase I [Patescibacteria group bacterium]
MAKTNPKLIIIDGNALIHRSFHALPPTMATKAGEMVNAVYGFTAVLLKAIREFKPEYVVLTLDRKAPTFRHEQYKEYKATRVKAPDELYAQIPRVKEIAESFSIPIFEKDGFEADDLIGTITKSTDGKIEKIIVTGDMDTLQLVNDHTKVYTMSHGLSDSVIYDEKAVKERFSLTPEQMIDFKALRGDPSDNIPGVKGIGEKGAIELLTNFKTLDGIYKNIESKKIKDRARDLLKEQKKQAYLSKDLATIKCDVDIDFNLEKTRFAGFNQEKVVKLFSELEFKSLLPRLHALAGQAEETKEAREEKILDKFERNREMFKYILINEDKDFNSFLTKLKREPYFTFDTETSSFDPLTARLLGISFSWEEGEAYFLGFKNEDLSPPKRDPAVAGRIKNDNLFNYNLTPNTQHPTPKISLHPWLIKLKPIFANPGIKKYGHNIKFDTRVIEAQGIKVEGIAFDTMIASYLLNPGTRQHNLDALTFSELGFEKISKDDLLGKGREKITFPEVAEEKLALYSCEDADFTNRLVNKLKNELKKQKLDALFEKIEMPLTDVLAEMENNGILIDKKMLNKMSKKVSQKLEELEKKIYREAGNKFNINSTQQLREILFTKLAIPIDNIKKNKTGLSTAADELDKLKDLHPIIPLMQEYRELAKLTTTYIDALPKLINKKTGRVHTSFNQAITATGRLSSTEPNLQNIPVRTELGREIRQAFVADKGKKLVSFDYSQIELRLAAHMSGDTRMIKAFKEGVDIHTATAAEINQVNPEVVTKNMRREAKAINFGILYGQGPHGLSQSAGISYTRAKDFIDQYFLVHKDIKKFIDRTLADAKEKGYVETLFGRRRYLPEINSSVIQVKKGAERMAVNAPLQGTAADLIKAAMIKIHDLLAEKENVKMLLQVHDELVFEMEEKEIKKITPEIKALMENVLKLKVPIVVETSVGDNWGEMEKI